MRESEDLTVWAVFRGGKWSPVRFFWAGRSYRVEKVHGRWERREGVYPIYSFALTAETGSVYELEFATATMSWRVQSVQLEGEG